MRLDSECLPLSSESGAQVMVGGAIADFASGEAGATAGRGGGKAPARVNGCVRKAMGIGAHQALPAVRLHGLALATHPLGPLGAVLGEQW
jgi:hypothetical protein